MVAEVSQNRKGKSFFLLNKLCPKIDAMYVVSVGKCRVGAVALSSVRAVLKASTDL